MTTPLTDEQIQNWRRVMVYMIGPYALIMSKEEIQRLHDKMQARVNEIEADSPDDAAAQPSAQGGKDGE